jgi:hypothetical protein
MATARKTPTTKSPTAAEALAAPIPVTFGGVDYDVLPSSEWPFEALEAFEDGKVATFLRHILGEEQTAAFRETKPTVATVREFVVALQGALGIAGN